MKQEKQSEIIISLRHYFQNREDICVAILFGSAAKNRLTPESDIDIAVAARKRLTFEEKATLTFEIARHICRDVDIVDLYAATGPILQQAICTGILIKKRTETYAALLKKMWFEQADMMPYTKMILEKRCEGFING